MAMHWAVLRRIPFQNLSPGLAIIKLARTFIRTLALVMDVSKRTIMTDECLVVLLFYY